ncbi:MAG: hypothetical protein HZA49_06620 [Planctomycetes bacterium]|nr:hypothetical protein [Planctomycetota bacterium]
MHKKHIALVLALTLISIASISCAGGSNKPDDKSAAAPPESLRGTTAVTAPADSAAATPGIPVNLKSCQEIVERISGKKFKSDVKGAVQSVEEFRTFVKKDLDKSFDEESRWNQLALSKLGLLPKNYDMKKGLENLLVSQAGAYYDPETKCMYFIKINMPQMEMETMVIHELTHALQDQYYDLGKLIKTANNSDQETAIRYLVEGEATYVMTIAQLEKMGITFAPDSPMMEMAFSRYKNLGRKDLLELSTSMAEQYKETAPDLYESIIALKDVPDYLFWLLIAPYYHGAYSIHTMVTIDEKQKNWQLVSGTYKNPPISTEQMIHTKKLAEPRDTPESITPPQAGDEWTILAENTMGEFGFWILFSSYAKGKAGEASEGWDGDKYFLLQNNKTKDIVLFLSTIWDSDNDAYESFNAYQKVLNKLYPDAQVQEVINGKKTITYTLPDNTRTTLTLANKTWLSVQDIPPVIEWK